MKYFTQPLLNQNIFIDTQQKTYKIIKHLDFHILRPVSSYYTIYESISIKTNYKKFVKLSLCLI